MMGGFAKLGLAASLAVWGLAVTSARADPPPQHVALGDLTFHFPPGSWQIIPKGDRLIATCMQEDCRDAVIDISRRDGEDGCTLETMAAEAERLFPAQDRAYANTLPAGRFALILAARHDGPDLSSPLYVHGCVPWQGQEYRFAMRPESVGTQSWIDGALHYLVSQATAPAAKVEELRLGGVTFRIPSEIWTISSISPGETALLICRMPTCHQPGQTASLSVHSPPRPCPDTSWDGHEMDGDSTEVRLLAKEAPDRLDFTLSTTFSGCRNYVPPHVSACSVLDGRSYHLSTSGSIGCRSSFPGIPDEALREILKEARITP